MTETHSEEKSGSPFLTPTFQSVLNRQLAKIMDALDYGDLHGCYGMLRTLICSLNPKDSKDFMLNDIKHIDDEIAKVMGRKSIDLYQTRRTQKFGVDAVLRRNLQTLFWKVMTRLHEGGYLEKQPLQPRAKKSGRLTIQ